MKIEQIYTGCLAQGAYYIQSGNEVAIIDPLREVEPYIKKADENGAKIKYVFETHFHADFVSGHIDLAKKTGATIVYGPTTAEMGFDAYVAKDDEEFKLGDISIKVLHTPGHTMESSCYLLRDEQGQDKALFTGDTLFIGDVGRPDLAQKVIKGLTQDKLAGYLFDSLRNKIMPLRDDIIVYPAHGAGSACGKNMSKDTSDTLGHQKETNYALRADMSKEAFKNELLNGLTPPPGYFPKNVLMNIQGYDSIDDVLEKGTQALSPEAFETAANETDALMLDTRDPNIFAKGFIPNSINIGIDGNFAPWVGTMIPDIKQKILLVADEGREEEIVTRLARVGYDHAIGYLKGGFESWRSAGKEMDSVEAVSASELSKLMKEHDLNILDVRRKSEYDSERLKGTENLALDYINENMSSLDPEKSYYVHCAGGYRSMIFSSILKSRGFDHVINITGGLDELKKEDSLEFTDYVCPTTLL